ncbi:MAG: 16S rRNA (guanine(966)-N(2))-methyltransferase RsmD [Firmicutes bacterium]|nr:16S rRNA (guanine(966)-N(2))-methyltransferase RsmD [Bacillota bacterium]
MRVGKVTTRETADMVKESVFNMLGGTLDGVVLDLFAGSGAYGLEAISRGASFLYAVDHDRDAIKTIIENAKILNEMEHVSVSLKDYMRFLNTMDETMLFDVVFIDPPYDFIVYKEVLEKLDPHLVKNALIVCESKKQVILDEEIASLVKIKERVYGIKRITIYQKK